MSLQDLSQKETKELFWSGVCRVRQVEALLRSCLKLSESNSAENRELIDWLIEIAVGILGGHEGGKRALDSVLEQLERSFLQELKSDSEVARP